MNYTLNTDHQTMVLDLCKNPQDILDTMTTQKMHLLHMNSKLCSEAGELMDAVGKNCFYNKTLDIINIIEELGDMEFYMQGIRHILGITREETLQANLDKLRKRYSKGYSDKAAQERADKT